MIKAKSNGCKIVSKSKNGRVTVNIYGTDSAVLTEFTAMLFAMENFHDGTLAEDMLAELKRSVRRIESNADFE